MKKATRLPTFGVFFPYALMMLLTAVIGISFRAYNYEVHTKSRQEILVPLQQEVAVKGTETIELGILTDNIYNYEPNKKTFDSDGWVWVVWSTETERLMNVHGMSAQDLFFFFNGVDDYDFLLVPHTVKPLRTPDGRFYQKYRYSGHFYVNDANFRLYPFQTVILPVAVELKFRPFPGQETQLQMVLDLEHSGVGSYIDIGGYETKGFRFLNLLHLYRSTHGEPNLVEGERKLPQARMEVSYRKAPMATVIKLIIPLFSVMALMLVSPFIPPSGWDARLAIPPTVMLTLIFLQQTYQSWIPEVPYITFMDSLYNIAYLYSLILFGLFLWGSIEYHFSVAKSPEAVIHRVHRMDRYFQTILVVLLPILVGINWYVLNLPW